MYICTTCIVGQCRRVAKVEVVSGVRFMRVGREIGVGKREI